eukprot:PhF_6_TR26274/c4_g1_i2/m.37631
MRPLFTRDCIEHIMEYTDTETTLSMFLVCRSWYHAVDRVVLFGDTFYKIPETFVDDIIRRGKIPPCLSRSLSTLQDDVRWGYVKVMVLLEVEDGLQSLKYFPPSLQSLRLSGSTDAALAHLSTSTSLTSLDLHECKYITDAG